MAGLFEDMVQAGVDKVVAYGSEVNDAPSIRRRTVSGNARADALMYEMRRSAQTKALLKKELLKE
jgi:hypothetical protein